MKGSMIQSQILNSISVITNKLINNNINYRKKNNSLKNLENLLKEISLQIKEKKNFIIKKSLKLVQKYNYDFSQKKIILKNNELTQKQKMIKDHLNLKNIDFILSLNLDIYVKEKFFCITLEIIILLIFYEIILNENLKNNEKIKTLINSSKKNFLLKILLEDERENFIKILKDEETLKNLNKEILLIAKEIIIKKIKEDDFIKKNYLDILIFLEEEKIDFEKINKKDPFYLIRQCVECVYISFDIHKENIFLRNYNFQNKLKCITVNPHLKKKNDFPFFFIQEKNCISMCLCVLNEKESFQKDFEIKKNINYEANENKNFKNFEEDKNFKNKILKKKSDFKEFRKNDNFKPFNSGNFSGQKTQNNSESHFEKKNKTLDLKIFHKKHSILSEVIEKEKNSIIRNGSENLLKNSKSRNNTNSLILKSSKKKKKFFSKTSDIYFKMQNFLYLTNSNTMNLKKHKKDFKSSLTYRLNNTNSSNYTYRKNNNPPPLIYNRKKEIKRYRMSSQK